MSALAIGAWAAVWLGLAIATAVAFRRERGIVVIAAVAALVIVEVAVFTSQNDVDGGLLNPSIGGGVSFSIFDVVATAAIVGVVLSGRVVRPNLPMVLWVALCVWVAIMALVGLARGFDPELVGFSARSIGYVLLLVPAASVPYRDYVQGWSPLVIVALAALLSAGLLAASAGAPVPLLEPDLPPGTSPWGSAIGGDAATVLIGVGFLCLIRAAVEERQGLRRGLVVLSVPSLVTALAVPQRAAIIGTACALVVIALAWLAPSWRARVRFTRTEWTVGGVAVAAAAVAFAAVVAVTGRGSFASAPIDAFTAPGKSATLTSRWDQWNEAVRIAVERPIVGQGFGFEYTVALPSLGEVRTTTLTHSVPIDLFLRGGAIAVLLALAAIVVTYLAGYSAWRGAQDARASALALACVAVFTSLVAKGLLESVIEKYRLVTFLGIVLGALLSAALAVQRESADSHGRVPRLRLPARVRSREADDPLGTPGAASRDGGG